MADTTLRVRMRKTLGAALRSKNIVIAVLFIVVMAVIFGVLWQAQAEAAGMLRDLYLVASVMPVLGILITVLSVLVYLHRQRRIVLRVDEQVVLPHSGVRFPVGELGSIQLLSVGQRSFVRLLPRHMARDGDEKGLQKPNMVAEMQSGAEQYTVEHLRGMRPKPYEFAEIIKSAYPHVDVEKLGSVRVN